ncbi:hypothetical protein Moror_1399 [Moniliophthora roreri MCA 2997]|uniref:Uncharacterized protein n=1 Tax=Moniliophthora roreri (strain MCA 2997) TaxID=1381753 RepID=V2WMQ9_MONRO|nr:hypothetical protein Moror_1399 [Moniliophthora roreri MCA 2997]
MQAHTIRWTPKDVSSPHVSSISDAEAIGNSGSTVVDTHVTTTSDSTSVNGDYTKNNTFDSIGNELGWTTVMRHRARSMEDLRKKISKSNLRFEVPKDYLSEEQTRVVCEAEKSLTSTQCAAIHMRNEKVQHQEDTDSTSEEDLLAKTDERPNQNPAEDFMRSLHNSGDPDMDSKAQRVELEAWNANWDTGIQVNVMGTAQANVASGSGSNNREDAVEHPGVSVRDETGQSLEVTLDPSLKARSLRA